jgi:hypothetical protein
LFLRTHLGNPIASFFKGSDIALPTRNYSLLVPTMTMLVCGGTSNGVLITAKRPSIILMPLIERFKHKERKMRTLTMNEVNAASGRGGETILGWSSAAGHLGRAFALGGLIGTVINQWIESGQTANSDFFCLSGVDIGVACLPPTVCYPDD